MRAFFGAAEAGGAVVSLSRDGRVVAAVPGTGASDLLALLERALKEAGASARDLDGIAVDRGPDGFSTVRRRVAVATGLARALGLPLASVSDLAPEAAAALPPSDFSLRVPIAPLYAGAPNITASKKKKTWTTR
jgi:tRNA threonylcarbamoyladenosine biosynthesis protein TsaB